MAEWDIDFELQSNAAILARLPGELKHITRVERRRTIKNEQSGEGTAAKRHAAKSLFNSAANKCQQSDDKEPSQISYFLAWQLCARLVFCYVPWLETSVWTAINLKGRTVPLCYAPNNCAQCWTTDSWQRCAQGQSSHASCGWDQGSRQCWRPTMKEAEEQRAKSLRMDCCSWEGTLYATHSSQLILLYISQFVRGRLCQNRRVSADTCKWHLLSYSQKRKEELPS